MNKKILFLFFLITSAFLKAQQPPILNWELKEAEGIGKFIKADHSGNIITVGATNYINSVGGYSYIRIIKQDPQGNIIWQNTFNDSLTLAREEPFDMVIDSLDNIYIAGRSNFNSSLPPPDFSQSLLLKYNSSGNALWAKRWGNNLQMGGGANEMKLFQNKFIYMVGYMDSWQTGYKTSFILQYDSSGILNWADISNFNYDSFYNDVEVDKVGNAYALGPTDCCLPGYDSRLVKYDLNGSIKWSRILTDSGHPYIYLKDAIIDDSANVIIVGETNKSTPPYDYDLFVSKIDSSGMQRWFTSYAATSNADLENIVGVLQDQAGGNYLWGFIFDGNGKDYPLVVKFSKDGLLDWSWKYDSLNGINDGMFNHGVACSDSSLIFAGAAQPIGSNSIGRLMVSLKGTGSLNWIYQDTTKSIINSFLASGTNIISAGFQRLGTSQAMDSLFICKFERDSLTTFKKQNPVSLPDVFPNPCNQKLNIIWPSELSQPNEINIYDLFGRKIMNNIPFSFSIDISDLPIGTYTLEVKDKKGLSFRFLIIVVK